MTGFCAANLSRARPGRGRQRHHAQQSGSRRAARNADSVSLDARGVVAFLPAAARADGCGTHGKTTSTSMMAHVLEAAGRDPSMLVGGVAIDFGSNYRLGNGGDFVHRGRRIRHRVLRQGPQVSPLPGPTGAIITAVEFDHADIYRDLDHVKSAFRALVDQMDSSRVLAVCADFPAGARASARDARAEAHFGLRGGEIRAVDIRWARTARDFR